MVDLSKRFDHGDPVPGKNDDWDVTTTADKPTIPDEAKMEVIGPELDPWPLPSLELPSLEFDPGAYQSMTKEEYATYVKLTLDRVQRVVKQKNNDYTAGGGPFDNFTTSAEFTGIDPVIGCMNRLMDKLQRIKTWRKNEELQVAGETVQDAVDDIIGYALIMGGIMTEEAGFEHLRRPPFNEQEVHASNPLKNRDPFRGYGTSGP